MNIDATLQGKTGIVTLTGRMEHDQSPAFETACNQLVSRGARNLVVDLSRLDYVSSMGIRAFLSVAKSREAAGARLILVQLGGFVKQVFDLTRLTALFQTADSLEAALQSLE